MADIDSYRADTLRREFAAEAEYWIGDRFEDDDGAEYVVRDVTLGLKDGEFWYKLWRPATRTTLWRQRHSLDGFELVEGGQRPAKKRERHEPDEYIPPGGRSKEEQQRREVERLNRELDDDE